MADTPDRNETNNWQKVPRPLRQLGTLWFCIWLCVILVSGFAYPLGRSDWAIWPWNQSWFMFYRGSGGKRYYLHVSGVDANGKAANVSLDQFFKYTAAFGSNRPNEMTRDPVALQRLASFVCRKYNENAASDKQLSRITVIDSSWTDMPGQRRYMYQVPPEQVHHWNYVDNASCATLQAETPS